MEVTGRPYNVLAFNSPSWSDQACHLGLLKGVPFVPARDGQGVKSVVFGCLAIGSCQVGHLSWTAPSRPLLQFDSRVATNQTCQPP